MTHERTIDEVFARNLRNLREREGWSRKALAEKLTLGSGQKFPVSRIVDLEWGRKPRPPAPIKWRELVALCVVFGQPIWELVLPEDDEPVIVVGGKRDVLGTTGGNTFTLDSRLFAEIISGLPGRLLTDPGTMEAAKKHLIKGNLGLGIIEDKQRELAEMMSSLRSIIENPRPALSQDPAQTPEERHGEHT